MSGLLRSSNRSDWSCLEVEGKGVSGDVIWRASVGFSAVVSWEYVGTVGSGMAEETAAVAQALAGSSQSRLVAYALSAMAAGLHGKMSVTLKPERALDGVIDLSQNVVKTMTKVALFTTWNLEVAKKITTGRPVVFYFIAGPSLKG